jgi:indole-3-glycerol phosphate synthase
MSDRLQKILGKVRERLEVRMRTHPLVELAARAAEQAPVRSLREALRRPGKGGPGAERLRVIGEVKRRSPSAGSINEGLVPADVAQRLGRAGCAALSVLTEPDFFGGSLEALDEVRAVSSLPLLRKDFIVEPYQLLEARAHGADAVLLLAAVLDDDRILSFRDRAQELGLELLVEAHGPRELERLLDLDLEVIGCNARDLKTFRVDLAKALEWCARVPNSRVCVAESGILNPADALLVSESAVDAALVGEGLMRGGHIEENYRRLFGGAHG